MGGGVDPVIGLLGKNGLVTREIARELISLDLQRKIKTTSEFARLFRAGQGTVQKAFKTLEDLGAIDLESRGHLGTFLISKDLSRLWSVSGLGTVTGVMPLPDSKEFEGIATALTDIFISEDIPLNLLHLNGSRRRIEHLKSGRADFVVLSRFSANQACVENSSLETMVICAPNSYYARNSLTVLTRVEVADRWKGVGRVGIDETSWDHTEITRLEFGSSPVEFVQTPYHMIPDFIMEGKIGAAVWHRTTRRVEAMSSALRFLPLQSDTAQQVSDDVSRLAVVSLRGGEAILSLFGQMVDPRRIVRIQNEVIEGKRIPLF
jgi:hypothetical protein